MRAKAAKEKVSTDALIEDWRKVYEQAEAIDELADKGGTDWCNLCVGWCLGKGLTVEQGYQFYQEMKALGLY
jgi:hypothetical protein